MVLKLRFALVAAVFAVGFSFVGCTDDEQKTEEPVAPAATEEPATPPAEETPAPAPTAFTPDTVYFAFDDYTISGEAQTKLNALADHLKADAKVVAQIEGHCDERGSIEYNLALGDRRAQSVKNYLVQLGVDAARLTTISYGEEKPASDGHDEAAWSQNRRAQFVLSAQ